MRILCLTPRFPYPVLGGDKLRIARILEFLARDHQLSLLSFVQREGGIDSPAETPDSFERVEIVEIRPATCRRNATLAYLHGHPAQVGYYSDRRMHDALRRMTRETKYDAILVHLVRMAQYLPDFEGLKVIELTDAVSMTYGRAARHLSFPRNLAYRFEAAITLRYERKAARSADHCVLVSEADARYLRERTGESNFVVASNGVDTDVIGYQDPPEKSHEIVFLGNMRTAANTDAVVYFAREILPLVRDRVPDARFTIVGNAPPPEVRQLRRLANVTVTGLVEDPHAYLRRAAVQVAPIRIAGGVQNKVLESMAAGTPVVASTTAAEGLDLEPGKHLLVADGTKAFADEVLRLLGNIPLRLDLARKARKHVEENYRWEDRLRAYGEIFGG